MLPLMMLATQTTLPKTQQPPPYLYKILSNELWNQSGASLTLPPEDEPFIHFSTADQLERILNKYWSDRTGYKILKIETKYLQGDLIFEKNPGGSAKYYHLYSGSIPRNAVVHVESR